MKEKTVFVNKNIKEMIDVMIIETKKETTTEKIKKEMINPIINLITIKDDKINTLQITTINLNLFKTILRIKNILVMRNSS